MSENIIPQNDVPKKSFIRKMWGWIKRHKLSFFLILFAIEITFIDNNNFIKQALYDKEIKELESEIERYKKEYEENTKLLEELNSDPEQIDKIARERYFMKKPNEDIYIFK
mgnify:CR=1 FL=1